MQHSTEIYDLIRTATTALARAQQLLDEGTPQPEAPISLDSQRRRRATRRWSSMKQSPRGVFQTGQRGYCTAGSAKVAVMLDLNLNFQVIEHGHRLYGKTYGNPSYLASELSGGAARNGFDHVVLEGRRLSDWRTIWLAA
jgi:hypothetical protein